MASGAALGFRSELIFHRADGEVLDRRADHGCRVIRTPSNPTYFWGNYLLFDRAPTAADAQRWPALFEQLIGRDQPKSRHRAFGWIENAPGEIDGFLAQGYSRDDAVVMHTTDVPAAVSPRVEVELRLFAVDGAQADRDWAGLLAAQLADRPPEHPEQAYRAYLGTHLAQRRATARAGRGNWVGAFAAVVPAGSAGVQRAPRRLVASVGIFAEANREEGVRIARYQSMLTDPAFRRRGLCRALIAEAARYARERLHADRFVIVADADDVPARIYADLGFRSAGLQRGLQMVGY